MKAIVLTALCAAIVLFLWLPARMPPQIFEDRDVAEAYELRTSTDMLLPETAAALTVRLLYLRTVVTRLPEDYKVRPYRTDPETCDDFAGIGRAAKRMLKTPWMRALKSMTVMALQRTGILLAAWIALLPFALALLVDGFVTRRIRSADMKAAAPTRWKLTLLASILIPVVAPVLLLFPEFPIAVIPLIPILHAFAMRSCAASWHRFI